MRRVVALVCLVLLTTFTPPPAAAQPLPTDPRLVAGECENGLKYVVARHAMPPLRAQVWLHVRAGSANETDQQRGAAHFISHLAFAGSENYPPDSVGPLLASLGMRQGADLNSHTGFTETIYKFGLREATPDAVGKALSFLRDIGQGLSFPAEAITAERAAILAEQRNAASVDQRIQEFLLTRLTPGSIMGDRVRLGTPESVSKLTPDDLRAFYRRWYVPSNMTVTVVGDLDPAETVRLISSTLGAGVRTPVPAAPDLGLRPSAELRAAVISDGELTSGRVYVLKGTPLQPPVKTVEDLRRRVLDSVAVGAFNRRLGAKIATGKFGFSEGGSFSSDLSGLFQLTGVYAASEPAKWNDALRAITTELQRARLHGLHLSEIEETKNFYLAQAEQNVKNEPLRQAGAYVTPLSAAASNGDAMMSAQQTLDQLRAILDALDQKTINDHFAELMDPFRSLVMLVVPSAGIVPTDTDVLAAGAEALKVAPAPEAEFVKPDALMSARPTPAAGAPAVAVVEERMHEASGVWSAWLSNGLRVHHRFMDVNKGQATITVAVAGGLIEESDITRGLTEAGSVAWSRPATSTLPSFVIEELLEGKSIEVKGGPGIDNLLLGVTGAVGDLETGMQLLHLLLTDPVIEAPGLDEWKREQLKQADARLVQPRDVFNEAMLSLVYPASETRPRPLTRAQIERVTLPAAQGWIRRQIATGPIEVSIVGDIAREPAMELVSAYLGTLPARARIDSTVFDDARRVPYAQGPQAIRREVAGLTETAFIMAGFRAADADNIADGRLLGLASQILNDRLAAEANPPATPNTPAPQATPPKLVHNVLVQYQPGQEFPGSGVFGAFAPTDAPKAEEAIAWIFQAFDTFAAEGPSVEELAKAKPRVTHQLEAALADPNFWTGQLSLLDYRAVPLDALADAITPYQAITPDDVKGAFARYYRPDARLRLVLIQTSDTKKIAPVGIEKGSDQPK